MDIIVGKAGVGVIDGHRYGSEGEGFVRINIGTQRMNLEQGLFKIKDIFDELGII